ncbi:cation-translocating P-type ATPase [Furfurilactobacillus siliginis]|uniref:Cation transport ATPase n=1 Tax=Furfurilactobacillus siliginis TaxID=348151 RepID=A0A0R2LF13_9LACO|nr:cation-translocating P-type ATPase [Furfurilactobacillus siliginis]KRN97223.1 cation transport ATPase [Furfurilactobacillus siliginis]GEK29125.1 magnesium-transporting ATPase [Furfurilactobacillus siliginis]
MNQIAQTENITDIKKGLTAQTVTERQRRYGQNVLHEQKPPSLWHKLIRQLTEVTSIILLIAVALSTYMAIALDGGWTKPIVIGAIVLLNVAIGLYQEHSAERALAALKEMSVPTARVRRNGVEQELPAAEITVGDVVLLNAGDRIPADGVLQQVTALAVDEAILTGESEAVEKVATGTAKDVEITRVFAGTAVTRGSGIMLVDAIGMQTQLGEIADLLNETKPQQTLLQKRLSKLALTLTGVAVLSGLLIFVLSMFKQLGSLADNLMMGVSLAVAAVPETLPVIVTISLAVGVQKMAKKHAIIRQISAVETIGSVDVIASDKTGTLTQNKMTITKLWTPVGAVETVSNQPLSEHGHTLMRYFGLATNANITQTSAGEQTSGDATELAIVRLLEQNDLSRRQLEIDAPRLSERPFSSDTKSMATLHKLNDGRYLLIVKGALDRLPLQMDNSLKQRLTQAHDDFARQALRILAVGYRLFDERPAAEIEKLEQDLTFAGIIGLIDPPRPEAAAAVAKARSAGIKPVMITGDHKETARAIAEQIGIYRSGDLAVTGAELDQWDETTLREKVVDISVFARVSPEDKIRIVNAWQQRGQIVAMTGDGVNDAPALKAANVGIAMGITGTEVAKGAADMILTDDNFATIIDAVSSGRTIYQNILKAVEFLVGVNFAQIFLMLGSVLMGWGAPLIAEQLLLINVLADGIPGFYLAREPGEASVMKRPPVPNDRSIFADGMGQRMAWRAGIYTLLTLGVYALGRFVLTNNQALVGTTMLFVVLAIGSMIDIYPIKRREPVTLQSIRANRSLNIALLIAAGIILAIAVVPTLQQVFDLTGLTGVEWLIVAVAIVIPTLLLEGLKRWRERSQQVIPDVSEG